MKWTRFFDLSSGGDLKENFKLCYIEAPYDEAVSVFYSRFGHNPHRVTCTCCGNDYSIREYESLSEATDYDRGSMKIDDFLSNGRRSDGVPFVIRCSEINDDERSVDVPEEGYVWK